MKFRRKAEADPAAGETAGETVAGAAPDPSESATGPFDVSQVDGAMSSTPKGRVVAQLPAPGSVIRDRT